MLNYPQELVGDWKAKIAFGADITANLQIFVDTFGGAAGLTAEQRLWMHHRFRAVPVTLSDGETATIDIMNFLICGETIAAYEVVKQMVPDPMDKPYHCVAQFLIDDLRNLIEEYLGLPLT